MVGNARLIIDWCDENGYSAWYLKEMERLEHPDTVSSRGRCHVLLLPQNHALPMWLRDVPQAASPEETFFHMADMDR
jgi:hypothetical protein